MRIPRPFYALIAAGALLFTTQAADAALMLRLTHVESGDFVTITDQDFVGAGANEAPDANPVAGAVTFVGGVGDYSVNVTTGLSKPILPGGPTQIQMHFDTVSLSSDQGGTLILELTDTDFFLDPGHQFSFFATGGVTGGSLEAAAFFDPANNPFAQTHLISALGPFGPGPFSGDDTNGGFGLTAPFSLTMVGTITHEPGVRTSSFDMDLTLQSRPVPTPGTLPLFLAGLVALGFGMYSTRRRRETAA